METKLFMLEDEEISLKRKFIECMACCHSASKLDEMMVGDPLDIQMFESTNWILDESKSENSQEEG